MVNSAPGTSREAVPLAGMGRVPRPGLPGETPGVATLDFGASLTPPVLLPESPTPGVLLLLPLPLPGLPALPPDSPELVFSLVPASPLPAPCLRPL